MKTHGHPLSVTAQHLHAGVDDYLQRQQQHYETAQELRNQYNTDQGVVWPNAHELRNYSQGIELSEHCFSAARECMSYAHRAQRTYSHHVALCRMKATAHTPGELPAVLSLAEVAQQHSEHFHKEHAPPGRSFTRSVLSTCHASNAPGVLSHVRTTEVSSP